MKLDTSSLQEQALKFDQDKVPLHLVDPLFTEATAHVLDYGRKKYDEWNWARGTFDWSRLYRAALSHLNAWYGGENFDPETGLPHLWHASCCLMFLTRYTHDGMGNDDRPVFPFGRKVHGAFALQCRPNWSDVSKRQADSLAKYHALKSMSDTLQGMVAGNQQESTGSRCQFRSEPAGHLIRPLTPTKLAHDGDEDGGDETRPAVASAYKPDA